MSGLHTDIKHKGSTLYVQTQDKGLKAHYVESLVYASGKVLFSRKTFYTSLLGVRNLKGKIRDIIGSQHKKILEDISSGQFDHLLTPEKKSKAPQQKTKKE
jgi:hypothetical protein